MDEILDDLGFTIGVEEICAMIRDVQSDVGVSEDEVSEAQEEVLAEVFPQGIVAFVTPRQSKAFYADFRRTWDRVAKEERENPTPLPLARLRRRILDVKAQVRHLLRELDRAQVDIADLPPTAMIQLSEIDAMLGDMLHTMAEDPDAAQQAGQYVPMMDEMEAGVQGLADEVRREVGLD